MQKDGNGIIISTIKGLAVAIIATLLGILVFAGIIKVANLNSTVIKSVNQFLKVLSVFLGCLFGISGKNGLIKGALIGTLSAVVTYLLFALIGSQPVFSSEFFIDLVFYLIIGVISGIITVNVKK